MMRIKMDGGKNKTFSRWLFYSPDPETTEEREKDKAEAPGSAGVRVQAT